LIFFLFFNLSIFFLASSSFLSLVCSLVSSSNFFSSTTGAGFDVSGVWIVVSAGSSVCAGSTSVSSTGVGSGDSGV